MRKGLRIYLPFAANELKRQLAYKGAFYLFILVHLFGSFISYYLWMAIYGSSEKEVIGGLTQSEWWSMSLWSTSRRLLSRHQFQRSSVMMW